MGADREAILMSAVWAYSWASLAQTFLCCFRWAFLQSREQYRTDLHVMQGLRFDSPSSESVISSAFLHWAHFLAGSAAVDGPAAGFVLSVSDSGWGGRGVAHT